MIGQRDRKLFVQSFYSRLVINNHLSTIIIARVFVYVGLVDIRD